MSSLGGVGDEAEGVEASAFEAWFEKVVARRRSASAFLCEETRAWEMAMLRHL